MNIWIDLPIFLKTSVRFSAFLYKIKASTSFFVDKWRVLVYDSNGAIITAVVARGMHNDFLEVITMGTNDKVLSVFGYFGIFFLVPLLAGNNSQFTRYHANQGLVLFLLDIVMFIIAMIINVIVMSVAGLEGLFITPVIMGIVGLIEMVFVVIGIIHAAQGEMKPLPVIGGITLIKA